MDYSKSGVATAPKKAPKHSEHNAPGGRKNPFGTGQDKAELLARMKAAAKRKDADAKDA